MLLHANNNYYEENDFESSIKRFNDIIRDMALVCNTKAHFLKAKDNYYNFLHEKNMCKKGGADLMMKYLQ